MILLIDNYDSFTFNIVHHFGALGVRCDVRRNDALSVEDALALKPQAIVLSPGPCAPNDAGICCDLIQAAAGRVPILGVCLGHQAIGQVFGAEVVRPSILRTLSTFIFHACLLMVGAQLLFAGADVFWNRYRHTSKLKMSREELKQEHRNTEGDPHVKGRLKALRAKAAKERMKEAVENATVIITNPTHYAVALHYEQGASGAPKIVAKGMDEVAARIR
ncbi:EscU/YscU/HrcU family type III secretion system export apparatus switch protein, partial [Neokomagataea thailandica]|uniref:EscU/YscU/HrcU family type III secretion system export apparatus switch protein n=1 Tax=Neokomagataea thailandica TaxID=661190 RepID=UPI000AD83E9A